jgi:ferritin-like protein
MSAEALHAPRERLSQKTLLIHHAILSIREELEAVDWYRQRADDCDDAELKSVLLHNMREEIEHACMTIEWLRRADSDFAKQLKTYLFSEGPITEVEEKAEGKA